MWRGKSANSKIIKKAEENTVKDAFESVPREVFSHILSFLRPKELSKIARVSKGWRIASNMETLWKKYAEEMRLYPKTDVKEAVIQNLFWKGEEKNIYYLSERFDGDPVIEKYKIRKHNVLFTKFQPAWERITGWTVSDPRPSEKNVVYKLFISEEQLKELDLSEASYCSTESAPAYSVYSSLAQTDILQEIKDLEVDVLQVSYAPVIGGKFQKVVPGSNQVKKDEVQHIENKSRCCIS